MGSDLYHFLLDSDTKIQVEGTQTHCSEYAIKSSIYGWQIKSGGGGGGGKCH